MERLRQRADFIAAAAGVRISAPAFTVQARNRRDPGPIRVGFTVSKKVGTAVERNRVRRRLREMVRRNGASFLQAHCDYVLIGRRAALSRGFDTMLQDFETALTRLDRQLLKRTTATPQAAS